MIRNIRILTLLLSFGAVACAAQSLSPQWEELTSPDFTQAIHKAGGVCVLPMGSVEKFGPSGPTGINDYVNRAIVLEAAKQEYAVVFPDYYVAGTIDVSNLPGTIAYSERLQYEMLVETTQEMARNGCKKILLVNGHSGNMGLITEFLQSDFEHPWDYVVYAMYGPWFHMPPGAPGADKMPADMKPSKPGADGHGGEERIAALLVVRPDLVHLDRAHDESGSATTKQTVPDFVQVGTSRLAKLPTGYEGDASGATAQRGKALIDFSASRVVEAIRAIKVDELNPKLQQQLFEERAHPVR
jgi:creatinine amidohydrolase